MKVLYIHQYFKTPAEGGALRSYYLAKALVGKGFSVDVITAHNQPKKLTKQIDDITVHYLPVFYDNSLPFRKRIGAFLRFVRLAAVLALRLPKPSLCYVMTTPLTTGWVGLWMKWTRRVPFVFEVGDLWPKVPIDMGVIHQRWMQRILYRFEKLCYQQARGIVALSPDIADYIRHIVPDQPLETIPNIADIDFFTPTPKNPELAKKYGVENKFVVSYTGTLGMANHLEYLLDAARSVAGLPIAFLVVGAGAEKEKLVAQKNAEGLSHLTFLPATNKEGVKEILAVSDAVFLSFLPIESLATGSPNKLFDGLAAGKLIISNFSGWTKTLIETNDAGFAYPPESPHVFAEKINLFMQNPRILQSFQRNARQLAENSFSLDTLANRQHAFLQRLMQPTRP